MGISGSITIEIKTKFNFEKQSVERTIEYINGRGLSCLAASYLGDSEQWDVNCEILRDTFDFDDGVYELVSEKFTQDGNSDWRWRVNE